MILRSSAVFLAVSLTAQPLVNEEVLEPSVRNEVRHALSLAPTNLSAATGMSPPRAGGSVATGIPVAWTNGLSRTQIAIRLVSAQGADGRWVVGTNDVTSATVEILEETLR